MRLVKRQIILTIIGSTLLLTACTKKDKTYTQQEIQLIVDSILQEKTPILKQQAQKDLELRLPIEIKPLIDSILNQKTTIPKVPKIKSNSSGQFPFQLYDNNEKIPSDSIKNKS